MTPKVILYSRYLGKHLQMSGDIIHRILAQNGKWLNYAEIIHKIDSHSTARTYFDAQTTATES